MKSVLMFSASDCYGGASRAAYRIFQCLSAQFSSIDLNITLRVLASGTDDPLVISGPPNRTPSRWTDIRLFANRLSRACFRSGNPILHSTAWLPSGYLREILKYRTRYDLVHLHWMGDYMLSIEEVGQLPLPVIWTLHDQWMFLGSEHYTKCVDNRGGEVVFWRYQNGYSEKSRPCYETGPDVNRKTWLRKHRAWNNPINIICPSTWMAECAQKSTLTAGWPISVIPYPIDLNTWAPVDSHLARKLLDLPQRSLLLLFGATGGASDLRKGADLLFEALRILSIRCKFSPMDDVRLIIFGQPVPNQPPKIGFPIHYMGTIKDELRLRLLYASADVFVVPSRQDNLPNTGLEAHACGTPIVAFRIGGLPDIVDDEVTGYLAEPYDPVSLASALEKLLLNEDKRQRMGNAARQRAERLWHPARIAALHDELYTSILNSRV